MSTQLHIIDRVKGNLSMDKSIALLWSAVLIAEKVQACTAPAWMIKSALCFHDMLDKNKFKLFMEWYSKLQDVDAEDITSTIEVYQRIRKLKSDKNKSKEKIILIHQGEAMMREGYKGYIETMKNYCAHHNLIELFPFTDTEQKKPLNIYYRDEQDSNEAQKESRFNIISDIISNNSYIPFFDSVIGEHFKSAELEKVSSADGKIDFISDFLFEFPSPLNLTSGQVSLVRSQMSKVQWKYFDALAKAKEELSEINFEKENFNIISEKFNAHTAVLKTELQKNIDETEVLGDLKKENSGEGLLKMSVGISSVDKILKMYRAQNMITEETQLYASEDLNGKIELNKSSIFLYLKGGKK